MDLPVKRPTAGEDEEDLLRLQAQFMKQRQNAVKKDVVDVRTEVGEVVPKDQVVNRKRKISKEPCSEDTDVHRTLDSHDTDLAAILTNICEMDVRDLKITTPAPSKRGFPSVADYQVSGDVKVGERKKKSMFAAQFDKTHNFTPRGNKKCEQRRHAPETSSFLRNINPTERMEIEKQTDQILNQMTEEEKRQEAEKIFKNMDPKLVAFLRKRKAEALQAQKDTISAQASTAASVTTSEDMETNKDHDHGECSHHDFLNPERRKVMIEGEEVEIPVYVKPGHIEMGELEPEKLQWMSDIPATKQVTSISDNTGSPQEVQVRFDFDGKIVPRGSDIHLDRGLHHHGEEPGEAGYTLDELFILSRSMVLRQRQIALETLVHVTQRARHSMYKQYIQQPMLQLLLDSGIVQLFRHAMDSTEYELAVQGVAALLLSPSEVFIQDDLYPDLNLYTLQPQTEIDKDMDHDTVLSHDVVRLLVDSQLPQRFWYLLSHYKLTDTLVNNLLNITQHLLQHSLHVTMVFVKHETLLDHLLTLFLPTTFTHTLSCEDPGCLESHPSHVVIKVLRLVCGYSRNVSVTLLRRYGLEDRVKMYLSVNHKEFKGNEMLKCQIEMARLWDVLLKWGLCTGVYSTMYPILVRELTGAGGQKSVKLTTALITALTTGLPVFSWSDVGVVYHPILTSLLSWANRPPSGKDLPPKDDIALLASVVKFLNAFTKLHHSKHFDVNLVDQVSNLVHRGIGPLVTGTLFNEALNCIVYCKSFLSKKTLQVNSLPTLGLHQYYKHTTTDESLDLQSISAQGEDLLLFYTCTRFIREVTAFITTAFNVNKDLSEVVIGFLGKCSGVILKDLNRHKQYKSGILDSDIPDLIFHGITQLQLDFINLSYKILRKEAGVVEGLEELVLGTGFRVLSELRPGWEYLQFQLVSGCLFDGVVNRHCASLGSLYLKSFEGAVTRDKLMKSQKYWNSGVEAEDRSLFVGRVSDESNLTPSWVFLPDSVIGSLSEPVLLEYLTFLEYLITSQSIIGNVPVCVQLIKVMKIFMLSSQPFLVPKLSELLSRLLDHFSSIPYIDYRESKLSGHPSFYDFYNTFCVSYEAEGFCNPVFAGYILLPTRCDYALTYRRLIWVERVETLRLLRRTSIRLSKTLLAPETDADMMTIYASALKNGLKGIPRVIAMHHLVRFFTDDKVKKEDVLLGHVSRYLGLCDPDTKQDLLLFEKVNEFNEVVTFEKAPAERRDAMPFLA